MSRGFQKTLICAFIAVASVGLTLLLSQLRFFQILSLKAQDSHFLLRGKAATNNITLITIDSKTLDRYRDLLSFWQPYYGEAMRGVADAGGKVLVLDVAFAVPVSKYEPDFDANLAAAFLEASQKMPIVCAFVPEAVNDSPIPLNMAASMMGLSALANLTADPDDFIRRQELIEQPKAGVPLENLKRSMALRAAEKVLGQDVTIRDGALSLAGHRLPLDTENALAINFAGPPNTFPGVPLSDFLDAMHAHNAAQLEKWVKGKAVLLGPDNMADRHDTPFFTFVGGPKWSTPGVEIHANTLNTLLTGNFLKTVPPWARILSLLIAAGTGVALTALFVAVHTVGWSIVTLLIGLVVTHVFFRFGWSLSSFEVLLDTSFALVGGVIYGIVTAERKSRFFRGAMALFVGKQFAQSLEKTQQISLIGKRQLVTILFTDIRGFTAFCESKDPAEVVDLLNIYMQAMVSIIVKYEGHVNKFIGDGILAVFSDDDEGAKPGDHAWRATACATAMVAEPVDAFRTGAGLHSGEVIIGNVGSSDKMEFTVLGDTVNLASRLESLNKDQHTKLLLSDATREMLGGLIDTTYKGMVPVRGKSEPMKLYTVSSLVEASE